MKKIITLFAIFLFVHSFCLYADNAESFADDPLNIGKKKPFGIQERSFEVGLANLDVNFANNFLSMSEIFQDVISIDMDDLSDGFMFNLGADITPFYFNFNAKKGWGFGLSTRVEAIGILGISGDMLTISEAVQEDSDIGGAIFASATINAHFTFKKLKIKINPSLFYTLAYVTSSSSSSSGLTYTLDYSNGTKLCIDYDIRIYSGFPTDDTADFELTAKPGLDFTLGFEYPLAKEIGLSKILPILDFDLGLDLINIPFIPSKISDYTQIKGRVGSDQPMTFFGDDGSNFSFDTTSETTTGSEEIDVNRPFKLLVHADWRPLFGIRLLTITPVIGFNYNELYSEPVAFEAGLNGCVNIANFFIVKAGINYTDRMFVNSLNLAINTRAFELDIGANIRSQDFAQSWTGSGLGVNFGLKFGW